MARIRSSAELSIASAEQAPRGSGALWAPARDEMNLAEFPLAILSTRTNPDVKTLEFHDTHRLKSGEVVQREWIITGADKFGLPTATDDDVVLGLICLTVDQGFRDQKVYFSRYQLLKILRWSTEGRSYQRLARSLDRLSGVRIRATNAFFDNSEKAYQTCNFGIIDAYEIIDGRAARESEAADEGQGSSFFIWSEVMFNSFQKGFIKKIDLDFYFSLRSAVSRRLYRHLDKHFYYRNTVERPLSVLAFEKLGLARSYKYTSSIKQQLEPAFRELCENGYLESVEYRAGGREPVVVFRAGPRYEELNGTKPSASQSTARERSKVVELRRDAAPESPAPAVAPSSRVSSSRASSSKVSQPVHAEPSAPVVSPSSIGTPPVATKEGEGIRIARALASRGVAEAHAVRLVGRKSGDELRRIEEIIEYFDHLVKKNGAASFRNGPGFLFKAVENPDRFMIPEHYRKATAPAPRRAERQVFSAATAPSRTPSASDTDDEAARRTAVAQIRASIDNELIRKAEMSVQKKLAPLSNVLSSASFQEAFVRCVDDVLLKQYGSARATIPAA
ncbi:MAG: replication initiator protein A [Deltaproteobacteria bacterium]|nr:replication initiator protein A [Deltaproteobacteria bacterium]